MTQEDTKSKILDSAETLFAENGFNATSTRQITSHANVNIASVNYHFGSKEKLMQAVLTRRLTPLNDERVARLAEVLEKAQKEGRPLFHGDILKAFVEPTVRKLFQNSDYRKFHDILMRMHAMPEKSLKTYFFSQMEDTLNRYIEALSMSFPNRSRQQNFRSFMFALGVMNHAIILVRESHSKDSPISHNLDFEPIDFEETVTSLLRFITKGMEEEV